MERIVEPDERALRLDGQVVIVTGGARGLGRSHALILAARGAHVVVNDLPSQGKDSNAIAEAVAEIESAGGSALGAPGDVTDPTVARDIVTQTTDTFGKVDILINNAGIFAQSAFADATLASFKALWNGNVGSTINMTAAVWPHFCERGYGRVVITGSTAGLYGQPLAPQYSAAKGALHGLAKSLASEGRERGIFVNEILPAGFTRMVEELFPDIASREQARAILIPEQVSPIVVWLSHPSCDTTGATIIAYAGRFAAIGIGEPTGYWPASPTPEGIRDHFAEVAYTDEMRFPQDAPDSTGWVFASAVQRTAPQRL